jgi:hypothetical protein
LILLELIEVTLELIKVALELIEFVVETDGLITLIILFVDIHI